MNARSVMLLLTALMLAVLHVVFFTDWFQGREIQVMYRTLPGRGGGDGTAQPLTFYLDSDYRLTGVRVYEEAEYQTNKYPHAVWHLIADRPSPPVGVFGYGQNIRGLKPKIPKRRAESLKPGRAYRMIIESGQVRGEKEFVPRS